MPEERVIHATLVEINGRGVLLTGEAGTGKSSLALELIDRGARFIADDAVCVSLIDGGLVGRRPSDLFRGVLAIRGIGFLDIARRYGPECVLDLAPIDICVELGCKAPNLQVPAETGSVELFGIKIPKFVFSERPAPVLVEAASAMAGVKEQDVIDEFDTVLAAVS